ncbi:hypothetical protein MFIFM68171_02791 [Madurella fahalii]|uniref:Secreted protein n=1 Tax=Madurella fahalii TaxID=1157608 RepID=A0ABQ0G4B3_9PEZI
MRWLKTSGIFSLLVLPVAVLGSPLLPRATPCDEIQDIMTDYGTLEGTLQGAMILLRMDGTEAGNVSRRLLTFLDEATLNIHDLHGLIPACSSAGSFFSKRQNPEVCDALNKVSADVAQAAVLMDELSAAPDLPESLYIEALQDAVNDAKTKIVSVETALQASDGCGQS